MEDQIQPNSDALAFLAEDNYDAKELYVLQGGEYTQLTFDGNTRKSEVLVTSGDGSTVVYSPYNGKDYYTAIGSDGHNVRQICESGYNFAGFSLTRDGTRMFYGDHLAGGGRLADTDGSGVFNLMPESQLWVTDLGGMSADGSRVCFCQRYESSPSRHRIYVGYLNQTGVVANEPVIGSMTYNPTPVPNNIEDTTLISTVEITAAEGVSDVTVRQLSQGKVIDGDQPLEVRNGPRDDGESPDQTAGDGIYTVEYRTNRSARNYDQVTLRIGLKDMAHTVTVVDTVLPMYLKPTPNEVVSILRFLSGFESDLPVGTDLSGNSKTGLEDVICVLQHISE